MEQKDDKGTKVKPTTLEFSLKANSPTQTTEKEPTSFSKLKKDIYYNLAEDNYFYLRDLMHENNHYNNQNYHKLSERLFVGATITLGFVPVLVSLLLEQGIESNWQITFLTLGIVSSVLSIILGFIDYFIEKNFWETHTDNFKRRVDVFNSALIKMRSNPKDTKRLFNGAMSYMDCMDQCAKSKSKIWAITIQFSLLLTSLLSLIISYLLSIYLE